MRRASSRPTPLGRGRLFLDARRGGIRCRYYREAETGIPMLAPEARLAIASSLRVYRGILARLEENDYDNFRKRAYTTKLEKFLFLPDAWNSIKDLPD